MPCVPCSLDFYILQPVTDWSSTVATKSSFQKPRSISCPFLGAQNSDVSSLAYNQRLICFLAWNSFTKPSLSEEDVTCESFSNWPQCCPGFTRWSVYFFCKSRWSWCAVHLVCNSLMARWGCPHPPPSRGRGCSKTVMTQCAECQGTGLRPLIIDCNQRLACYNGPRYTMNQSHTKCSVLSGWLVWAQRFVCVLHHYNSITITATPTLCVCVCAHLWAKAASNQLMNWFPIICPPSSPFFSPQ